ncbi:MAG: endolytic transglycosylase MltG [Patescibacteria group bacterium UBA2103]
MIQNIIEYLLRIKRVYIIVGLSAITVLVFMWGLFFNGPKYFPVDDTITIPQGVNANEIADILLEERVIESKSTYILLTRLFFNSANVKAGDYYFGKEVGPLIVAYRIANGVYGVEPVSIVFPEGITIREIAARVHERFPHISEEEFKKEADGLEGYLFPETYYFEPNISAKRIVQTMYQEFTDQIDLLEQEIRIDRPLSDVIIMASILEKEARQFETKQRVAGILWDRIEIGMALQVDAVFGYIYDTDTFHPSLEDLEIDSPYNTYKNRGLPPGAISNPGIESIRAAADPIKTPYLFYLTGRDGNMYYAETFDGHRRNRALYLD